ncbi:MAG: channel protein TolC [Rhodocyclaceae bacterium]|nr:MAG: channel protein TolC [Rhodocyclaceae bacterium]
MKPKFLTTALILAFGAGAGACSAADLMGVYRDALGYDAQFASAKAAADAGREALPQGRAGLLPNISLSANSQSNNIDATIQSNPSVQRSANYNSKGWTVTLTQPLFRWDRWAGYNQAEAKVAASEAQFGLAKQDLIVRVAQAYFDVLQADEALSASTANRKAIAEQLEEAKKAFEVGTKTVVEVHDAQARYDLATAQEIVADNDLAVKRQQLRLVAGKDYPSLKNLRNGLAIPRPQPDDGEKWVESAEQGYLGVQAAQAQFTVAEQEVSKQRAGHLPSLDLVASRGRAVQDNNITTQVGSDSTSTVVGVQLTIPIFSGGAVSSAVSQSIALKEKANADLDNARRSAALLARQSYLGVSAGLAQVRALEAALVSSQSALESNKLGFEVGVRTNIEVLNAQSQYYDTRQKLKKARLDTLAALLKLKGAAGTLNESDLEAINGLLE